MTKKKSVKKNKKTNSDKIKSLNEKIDLANAELEIIKDKNVRLLAEFDNFKRRTNQTISDKEKYEGVDFIKEIIKIIDDFDRVLNIESIVESKSVFEGIELIKNKFISVLKDHGVESYNSIGEVFDTSIHEAVMMKKSKKKSNIILEEYQAGYKYHDKVVRHAKVIVSE
tara:strand:+ start:319 stop:825 length:507 start_codon:yes stop_codon:yes gene_type:complete